MRSSLASDCRRPLAADVLSGLIIARKTRSCDRSQASSYSQRRLARINSQVPINRDLRSTVGCTKISNRSEPWLDQKDAHSGIHRPSLGGLQLLGRSSCTFAALLLTKFYFLSRDLRQYGYAIKYFGPFDLAITHAFTVPRLPRGPVRSPRPA